MVKEEGYYIKSSNFAKDICIKIKDSVFCSDGCTMIIKLDIALNYSENRYSHYKNSKGNIKLSIIKIKTDSLGTPKLFSKMEKIDYFYADDIEFSESYDSCKIKKEIVNTDINEKCCLDIELEEITRHSGKTVSVDKTYERRIFEEAENINSYMKVMGKINDECFSDKAESSLSLNWSNKIMSTRNYLPYMD